MTGKKQILILFFIVPFLFNMAVAEENHASGYTEFLGKAINFFILFGGLAYILFKPIRNFLYGRAVKIDRSLKDVEDSRRKEELKLEEVKNRLRRLEEEITKIKKESEIEGQREKDRIIKDAQREAEKVRHFAKEDIEMLTRAGIQELKEYTAELATELAQQRIKKKMTDETQSLFIDKSIFRLEKLYEKSDSNKEIHSRAS